MIGKYLAVNDCRRVHRKVPRTVELGDAHNRDEPDSDNGSADRRTPTASQTGERTTLFGILRKRLFAIQKTRKRVARRVN
jgi:hypothetical protein